MQHHESGMKSKSCIPSPSLPSENLTGLQCLQKTPKARRTTTKEERRHRLVPFPLFYTFRHAPEFSTPPLPDAISIIHYLLCPEFSVEMRFAVSGPVSPYNISTQIHLVRYSEAVRICLCQHRRRYRGRHGHCGYCSE